MDTKALRQKILDLAIRGKLVPQDPNDEPASVLLEKIRAEKQQMVKDGRLKTKDIKNDTIIFKGEDNLHYEKFQDGTVKCIEDEIPFELPDGWSWCRLGTICDIVTGRLDANAQTLNGEYPFFTCGEEVFRTDSYAFDCNAILLGGNNATGDFKMHKFSGKFNAYQRVYVITTYLDIDIEYLYSHIRYYLPKLQEQSIGSQTRYLKLGMITDLLIALSPANEQANISALCEQYLSYCISISAEKVSLSEIIKKTKSKILDLAIRGQLVPQDPNDEPASVLLERIRAEKEELIKAGKIKRDKKESIIFKGDDNSYYEKVGAEIRCIDSEIPFEIPDGWIYERLGNICSIARGGSPRPIENYLTDDENGLNWIKIGDAEQGGKYIYSTKEKIRPEGLSKTRYVCRGDFLLTNSMSFGRPYILRTNGCIHDGWLVIGGIEIAFHQDYLYYMLSSSIMYNALSSLAVGSTVKNLKSDSVKSLLVPIPPLAEQACISRQIENYFATMLQIERSLS